MEQNRKDINLLISLSVVVLLIFSLVILIGCSRSAKNEQTIEFWTIDLHPKFDDYINSLIADFETTHTGLKIRWIDVPISAIHQKFIAAIAARRTPDIINLNTDLALQFAELGALTNLDKEISKKVKDLYFPGLWQASYFKDNTGREGHYAFPWYVTTQLLIYNKQILTKTGLNPEKPPATWETFWRSAKEVKARTGVYGVMPSIKFIDELIMDGIPVVSPDRKKALFDHPDAIEKLKHYVELYNKDEIPRESIALGKSYQRALEMYQGGNLGFLLTGPQFLNRIQDNAPSVYAATDVAPLPIGKAGIIPAATMNLAIPLSSKHKDIAIEFALFVTNSKNQLLFCQIVPVLPSIQEAANDSFFLEWKKSQYQQANKAGNPEISDQLLAKARYLARKQLKIARDLNLGLPRSKERSDVLREMLESALLGRRSPQDALTEGARRWTLLLQ